MFICLLAECILIKQQTRYSSHIMFSNTTPLVSYSLERCAMQIDVTLGEVYYVHRRKKRVNSSFLISTYFACYILLNGRFTKKKKTQTSVFMGDYIIRLNAQLSFYGWVHKTTLNNIRIVNSFS